MDDAFEMPNCCYVDERGIVWCPVHAHAEELLAMVKDLMAAIDSGNEDAMLGQSAMADALVWKAEGVLS